MSPYSIFQKRSTTINHAFASAIAPCDGYDAGRVSGALRFLGQDPDGDLLCVYCGYTAQTWDHLVSLVKAGQLQGFGHQLGNLVPSCKACNSAKGSRDFSSFIETYPAIAGDRAALAVRLTQYQQQFANPVDIGHLQELAPDQWTRYSTIKQQIFDLMKEADVLAQDIRQKLGDSSSE